MLQDPGAGTLHDVQVTSRRRRLEGTLKDLDLPLLLPKSGSTLLMSYLTHILASLFLNTSGDGNFLDFPAVYPVISPFNVFLRPSLLCDNLRLLFTCDKSIFSHV